MSASEPTAASFDTAEVVAARRRELAVEHILFGALRHLAGRHPEMLDELEASLPHLWDRSEGTARDDEAVREIARRFIKSLRAEA
ncbi:hypothetical protein [Methylobacterium sp. B4]|uniref:hypothetical protein n=1 Tax=Methylobacterium sp. B4 TaxID=1938755 RepID=UPI000D98F805|nr:hypothetical protein [Methylobacterium sp. B4]PXW55904.1 hypothetical protein BY998_11725 [Methylobacterium sp. B4]